MCINFPHSYFEIDENISLLVINIEELDSNLVKILDEYFVSICEGDSETELGIVKKEVENLFKRKPPNWIQGAVAEFFTHLILKMRGFKQEFLFINLEENSIKKGFDGFYSRNGEEWIMESKSGAISSRNISHAKKISVALKDLADRVSGRKENGKIINPWHNAYSHASHCDVKTAQSIRDHIKKLYQNYIQGIFHEIEEFNNIPSATLFLEGAGTAPSHDTILTDIKAIKRKLKGERVFIVCMTQNSVNTFKKYLRGI